MRSIPHPCLLGADTLECWGLDNRRIVSTHHQRPPTQARGPPRCASRPYWLLPYAFFLRGLWSLLRVPPAASYSGLSLPNCVPTPASILSLKSASDRSRSST